ncbi:MAG: extracellular solute-binding protein [Deltaproteobacteria bacterium]|nr:extracellular solute-binding protein [Deltaproteobacteria bacterium]
MKYRLMAIIPVVFMLMVASNDALGQGWEHMLQKLYMAAKPEGSVAFNSGGGELSVGGKEGIEKFTKRFPGIRLDVTGISSTKLFPRIVAEARAGKISIDVDLGNPPAIKSLIDRGLIATLNPTELTDKPEKVSYLFDTRSPVARHQLTHFVYNTKLVSKADLPKRYEDLLDPKWKGKIGLDGRGPWEFTLLRILWGEQKFWQFIKSLGGQNPVWDTRCSASTDRVVTGEAYFGCGTFSTVHDLRAKGAPLEFVPLSPMYIYPQILTPYKGAAHPNAAKLLIAWLLSPEGIEVTDKIGSGLAIPGTRFLKGLKAIGVELHFGENLPLEQLLATETTRQEIAKAWGVLR